MIRVEEVELRVLALAVCKPCPRQMVHSSKHAEPGTMQRGRCWAQEAVLEGGYR
jgi:hypothetical protein